MIHPLKHKEKENKNINIESDDHKCGCLLIDWWLGKENA